WGTVGIPAKRRHGRFGLLHSFSTTAETESVRRDLRRPDREGSQLLLWLLRGIPQSARRNRRGDRAFAPAAAGQLFGARPVPGQLRDDELRSGAGESIDDNRSDRAEHPQVLPAEIGRA